MSVSVQFSYWHDYCHGEKSGSGSKGSLACFPDEMLVCSYVSDEATKPRCGDGLMGMEDDLISWSDGVYSGSGPARAIP